ncbi:hypothetical protein RN001_005051 [Aquatica leii]|uniref:Uncharacterized protein n=1 Tax=Aquatica leii TaxID=1421715 RepID=A0AAN7SHQ8_9COLE|nr:hypothetical protein RN001_005051 [Aquatica leii]
MAKPTIFKAMDVEKWCSQRPFYNLEDPNKKIWDVVNEFNVPAILHKVYANLLKEPRNAQSTICVFSEI